MTMLQEKDLPALIEELKKDRRNLFFLNNLDIYKLGKEINVYKIGDAFTLNWMDASILIFAPNGYDKKEMLEFLSTQKFNGINGAREYLEPIEKELEGDFSIQYRDFMMVDKTTYKKLPSRDTRLRELFSPDDYEALFDLYMKVPSCMGNLHAEDREEWALDKAELEYPMTGVGLFSGDKIISGAYLGAATKTSAMVVGVSTDPDEENKGYATSVMSELTDIALNENNIGYLCLWYSEEKARHIYEKIGFKPIGKYAYFSRKEI